MEPGIIKCLVTDLDNTLWSGVLLEDGPENVVVDRDYLDCLKRLGRRGILLAVASKNVEEDALAVLRREGVDELFVEKQIDFATPKSESISRIARDLDIGAESIALVDDQPFELEEVRHRHPNVLGILKPDYEASLASASFAGGTTWEARNRGLLYRAQKRRKQFEESIKQMDADFLRSLSIRIRIRPACAEDLERVTELILRSHQLNFSSNMYGLEEVKRIFADKSKTIYVISVEDRFGPYGLVGICIVDRSRPGEWFVQDLLFSCRVQGRGIESATIAYFVKKAREQDVQRFTGAYRQTEKNVKLPATYADLGFTAVSSGDKTVFRAGTSTPMPVFDYLSIEEGGHDLIHKGIPFVRRWMEGYLKKEYPEGFPDGFKVLDVGAGWGDVLGEDWRDWMRDNVGPVTYARLDQRQYGSYVDVIANAETMSSDDRIGKASFDLVLCFEALEHAKNPLRIIEEMAGVVKPGGSVIASVPYRQPEHYAPEDYWRFSPSEFRKIFEEHYTVTELATEGPYDNPRRTLLSAKPKPALP